MLKMLLTALIVLALLVVSFFLIGPDRIWALTHGNPDLGPMALDTLSRSDRPHDAMACTQGLCDAKVDLELPAFSQNPAALLAALEQKATQVTPGAKRVDDQTNPLAMRFVTYSKTMRFPDTTWVEAVTLDDGTTGLRIYAKAQIGYSDMGANLARITAWVEGLESN